MSQDRIKRFLLEHPRANRQEVMRATGASARAIRAAEAGCAQRRPRWPWAAGLLVAATGSAAILGTAPAGKPVDSEASARDASARLRAVETTIYEALDSGDATQSATVARQLDSPDPTLRVAALRFLAKLSPSDYADRIVQAMSDTAPRVRKAAIQLATGLPVTPATAAALLEVGKDPARELAERVLALSGLRHPRWRTVVGDELEDVWASAMGRTS